MEWPRDINWTCPAGQALDQLIPYLPKADILVFGSAALQLTVSPGLMSQDVDLAVDVAFLTEDTFLRRAVEQAGLSKSTGGFPYIQVSHWQVFESAPGWGRRVMAVPRGPGRFLFPHPYDILFSKLRRLEPKDLQAFHLVMQTTGHPTEQEFLNVCREAYREFYRENRRKSAPDLLPRLTPKGNIRRNVVTLWKELWGHSLSIERAIIEPAVRYIESERNQDTDDQLKSELRRIAEE